jgi:hypothetical protein
MRCSLRVHRIERFRNIRLGTTRWGGHHGSISALVRKHSCTASTILRPNRRNPHFCHLSIAAARKCERVDVLDGHGVIVRGRIPSWVSPHSCLRQAMGGSGYGHKDAPATNRFRDPARAGMRRKPGIESRPASSDDYQADGRRWMRKRSAWRLTLRSGASMSPSMHPCIGSVHWACIDAPRSTSCGLAPSTILQAGFLSWSGHPRSPRHRPDAQATSP